MKNYMLLSASNLISSSIINNTITHGQWDPDVALELMKEADDYVVENDKIISEFWGSTNDKEVWRVHLHK